MSKAILTSVLALLAGAALVRGQPSESPAPRQGDTSPAPPARSVEGAPFPSGKVLLPPPGPESAAESPSPLSLEEGPNLAGQFAVGGEYLLWWLITRHDT